jgi:CubicO group peptidase (beta-lactamase class C family)
VLELEASLTTIALETRFSGVVRVDRDGVTEFARSYGLARRGDEVPNTLETRFGIASGTKGLTALTVMHLIADGRLSGDTTARSILGDDLPLIRDDVTVEQLLAHRSGIGDYVDEEIERSITDRVLTVSPAELVETEDYVKVLDGFPTKFAPDERFSYCNAGFVVLALIAERTAGTAFADLVQQIVCEPAGMSDTAFLRSDELPGGAAIGYLHDDGLRTNVFDLPARGSGDGGIYSTLADVHALWAALDAGAIVPREVVDAMLRPRSESDDGSARYGLGFWLHRSRPVAELHGSDVGVSFATAHEAETGVTYTVIANTSEGAWPLVEHLDVTLFG